MRKQALIHLHGLCVLLRSHFEEHRDLPPGAFESYDRLDVAPTGIHRRKDAHREAVTCLMSDLAEVGRRRGAEDRLDPVRSSRPRP